MKAPVTVEDLLAPAKRPRVVAHRGWSARFPENTLPALQSAVAVGADAVEIDVRLTADGVPVVFHDERVERTTNGMGRVRDLTLAQLKALDAGSWKGPQHRGLRVPTFEEVVDALDGRVPLNVELKDAGAPAEADRLAESVARVIEEHRVERSVLFSSFDPLLLDCVRRRLPAVARGRLYDGERDAGRELRDLAAEVEARFLGLSLAEARSGLLGEALGTGLPVFVYTVDDPKTAEGLARRGVRALFSNAPDLLLRRWETA